MANPSSIEGLLPEVQLAFMSSLDDVHDLVSFVLSSRNFYAVFMQYQRSITRKVLLKQVGRDVLPSATIAVASSKVTAWDDMDMNQFLEDYFSTGPQLAPSYDTKTALQISTLHKAVIFLSDLFIDRALADMPDDLPAFTGPPTELERTRILRAFYMREYKFNLYAKLSHRQAALVPTGASVIVRAIWTKHSRWEHTQASYVNQAISTVIELACREAENRIALQPLVFSQPQHENDGPRTIRYAVLRIVHFSGLAELHSLLHPEAAPEDIYAVVQRQQEAILRDTSQLHIWFTFDPHAAEMSIPFHDDDRDPGPRDAWYRGEEEPEGLVFRYPSRLGPAGTLVERAQDDVDWGPLLWDRWRLEGLLRGELPEYDEQGRRVGGVAVSTDGSEEEEEEEEEENSDAHAADAVVDTEANSGPILPLTNVQPPRRTGLLAKLKTFAQKLAYTLVWLAVVLLNLALLPATLCFWWLLFALELLAVLLICLLCTSDRDLATDRVFDGLDKFLYYAMYALPTTQCWLLKALGKDGATSWVKAIVKATFPVDEWLDSMRLQEEDVH